MWIDLFTPYHANERWANLSEGKPAFQARNSLTSGYLPDTLLSPPSRMCWINHPVRVHLKQNNQRKIQS